MPVSYEDRIRYNLIWRDVAEKLKPYRSHDKWTLEMLATTELQIRYKENNLSPDKPRILADVRYVVKRAMH